MFIYRGPLPPDSLLFRGRTAELDKLMRLCQGPVQAYAIVYGGRQTGKTSLLLRLSVMLPESVWACRVDFQRIPGATSPQVYGYLAQCVSECLSANDQASRAAVENDTSGQIDLVALRDLLDEHFNEDELRDLCFEMETDYESLSAASKKGKARELVADCKRKERTLELVERCRKLRPKAAWPRQTLSLSVEGTPVHDAPALVKFLCQAIGQPDVNRFVLLLEELGALPQSTREDLANVVRSIFTGRFDASCRALSKLMVVLAGSVELYELAASQVSTLHNICNEIYLPDLSDQEAVGLVADELIGLGLPYTDAETFGQAIYTCAGGHPYLTQRIGALLEESLVGGKQLTPASVDRCVEQLLRDDPLLHHLRQAVEEQLLLTACKSLLNKQLRFSRLDEEMARLELLGLAGESEGYWTARNRLLERALREWTVASS